MLDCNQLLHKPKVKQCQENAVSAGNFRNKKWYSVSALNSEGFNVTIK